MMKIITWLQSRDAVVRTDEEGQGLAEYGLILALVSVVAITALTSLGGGVTSKINEVVTAL